MTRWFATTADDEVIDLGEHGNYFDALLYAKRQRTMHMPSTHIRDEAALTTLRDRINQVLGENT